MMNKNTILAFVLGAIFVLVGSSVLGQFDRENLDVRRAWILQGDVNVLLGRAGSPSYGSVAILLTPEPVHLDTVRAAWSYAIRYGADGFDLINYDRAVELMMERHPGWIVELAVDGHIVYEPAMVDLDTPDDSEIVIMPECVLNPEATEESP
jgi:hypothetical protein